MSINLPHRRALLSSLRPGWAHPKAALALDFLGNRAWRAGSGTVALPSALTTVRASSHLLTDADGALQEIGPNALASLPGVGAYIGGQVINKIRNPRGEGGTPGVIGSGGVAPTYWSVLGTGAWLTVTYHGAGVEDGWPYTEWEFAGTNNTGSQQTPSVYINATGYSTTAPSQPWSLTLGARYIGSAPTHPLRRQIAESASNDAYLRSTAVAVAALTASRAVYSSRGTTGADTASVRPAWYFIIQNGETLSARIRVYAPMMVNTLVAPAPPVLPPVGTPGDSTRLASDVRAIASGSEPFAGWNAAGLDAGFSVLATVNLSHVGDGALRMIAGTGTAGSANSRVSAYIDAAGSICLAVTDAGGSDTFAVASGTEATGRFRVAVRAAPGYYRIKRTGAAAGTSSNAATIPAAPLLFIGQQPAGTGHFNDTIERIEICRPLTDTEMDAWVAA